MDVANIKEFKRNQLIQTILRQNWPTHNNQVFYVIAYKESQSGLLFNERLLVVQDYQFTLFYTKQSRPISALLKNHSPSNILIKNRVPCAIISITRQQNIIHLKFQDSGKKGRWMFKFHSKQLAEKWAYLFHQIQQKFLSKTVKSKETGYSTTKSESSVLGSLGSVKQFSKKLKTNEMNVQEEILFQSKRKKLKILKLEDYANF